MTKYSYYTYMAHIWTTSKNMNRGTPKQQQLEAEFVSSTQSKHYKRIQCALAISLETDISKDAREISKICASKVQKHFIF